MSADEQRANSVDFWDRAAPGWIRAQEQMRRRAAPVSNWMVDAIRPQSGHRILELAAGLGETGMLAAELVAPAGDVLISDQSEAMLDGARARAKELGIANVDFRVLDGEWIDLPVAALDGVLCRFGYMLMIDPAAALRETRRVLRSGGRLALAVWDSVEVNPWAQIPTQIMRAHGASPSKGPGPFALGDRDVLRELIEEAGFEEIEIEAMELPETHPSFDDFWQVRLDLSVVTGNALAELGPDSETVVRGEIEAALAQYGTPDGGLSIPGRVLLAQAEA